MTAFGDKLEGFDEHWRALEPEVRAIEAMRWRHLIGAGLLILLLPVTATVLPPLLWALGVHLGEEAGSHAAFFIAALQFGFALHLARKPSRLAGRLIKEKVCGFFGFCYADQAAEFPFARFEELDILPGHNRRNLRDHIEGEIDGVPVQMCDAHLKMKSGSGKRSRTRTVFRGPLLVARNTKTAQGRTIVVPDGGTVGNFFGGLSSGKGERVALESPDFEKAFEVYSSDQVAARYLLTPTAMERLLAFRNRLNAKIWLGFEGQEILIAIYDNRDWFPDPGLFQKLTDPGLVHRQAEEIHRLARIVEALHLTAETRI